MRDDEFEWDDREGGTRNFRDHGITFEQTVVSP